MVRINSLALAGLVAVGASAFPSKRTDAAVSVADDTCMTASEAQAVATTFGTLIANYTNELADKALAVNFTDYSESVNTLINTCPQGSAAISLPLLSPTFSSREQFEIGQGQQPPINFQQLNIWPGCRSVSFRWMTNNTAPIPNPRPVVGIITLEVVPNTNATAAADYPWLIDYTFSEFDAGAWLQNLQEAGICGTPPADSPAIPLEPTATGSVPAATCTCAPAISTPPATSPATSWSSSAPVPTPYASSSAPVPTPYGSSSAPVPTPYGSSSSPIPAPYGSSSSSGPVASPYASSSPSAPAAYPYGSSSASAPAATPYAYVSASSSSSGPVVYVTSTVTAPAYSTSTAQAADVGPDGYVIEEPCKEEE